MATIARKYNLTPEEYEERIQVLEQENAALREENRQLRMRIETLEAQYKLLQALLFGRSAEQTPEPPDDSTPPEKPKKGSSSQKEKSPKRRNHQHLPLVEETKDLPEDKKKCPCCGKHFAPFIDVIEGETIEINVKGYRRRIRRKSYKKQCHCKDVPSIITAPTPGKLLPKGSLGISLWVKLLLGKFLFYNPTYRTLEELKQDEIDIPQSTVNDGLYRLLILLRPIYQAIGEKNKKEERWNVDETGWLVHEKGGKKEGTHWFLWVFKTVSTVFYSLSPTRSAETLQNHLEKADGTISCDRYSAYKKYAAETEGNISLAYCWAHVRRDYIRIYNFHPSCRPWAQGVLNEIGALYKLHAERRIAYQTYGQDSSQYEEIAAKFTEAIHIFKGQRQAEVERGGLAECQIKTQESLEEHWHGLTEVIHDPELDMDNNAAERALRGPVIGRKNFWGSMMEWSAELAVIMFTILQTLLLWGINPKKWLQNYFEACAANKGKPLQTIDEWLPWNVVSSQAEDLKDTGTDPP